MSNLMKSSSWEGKSHDWCMKQIHNDSGLGTNYGVGSKPWKDLSPKEKKQLHMELISHQFEMGQLWGLTPGKPKKVKMYKKLSEHCDALGNICRVLYEKTYGEKFVLSKELMESRTKTLVEMMPFLNQDNGRLKRTW
jgi:hypothetical protein